MEVYSSDRTFIEMYLHATGAVWNPIPPSEYQLWGALSLISGAVGNRIWFERFRGKKLHPHLYTMLLGPPGTGKNVAIDGLQNFVERLNEPEQFRIDTHRGKITPQAIFDKLGKKVSKRSNIWIMTPELAMAVGQGGKSWDWVTHFAEMHDGGMTIEDQTRGHGSFKIKGLCVNWISGTNEPWLLKTIDKEDILGGFFARICPVCAPRARFRKPVYPYDAFEAMKWCEQYISALTWMEGEMFEDKLGGEFFEYWTDTRVEPMDEMLHTFWDRGPERVQQLAMVLSLSDNMRREIGYYDYEQAVKLWNWLYKNVKNIFATIQTNPELQKIKLASRFIKAKGEQGATWTSILKFLTNNGLDRRGAQMMVTTLTERKEISVHRSISGMPKYVWTGGNEED